MAGGSEGGEKTEKPTAKKLQDAAKKGDILQSRELGTALVVMAGIGCMAVIGPALIDALQHMLGGAGRVGGGGREWRGSTLVEGDGASGR